MKRINILISLIIFCSYLPVFPSISLAQRGGVRPSLKATVTQRLGADTDITIEYSRPGVKGRKIWGGLVPYGLVPGSERSQGRPVPWRAGANENTTIECNNDVLIEGQKLPAGKYGVHMIPSEKDWVIIFNKNNSSWGSYSYNEEEDALRVTVTPVQAGFHEWLLYGFGDLAGTSATAYLLWDKLRVPFTIKLAEK